MLLMLSPASDFPRLRNDHDTPVLLILVYFLWKREIGPRIKNAGIAGEAAIRKQFLHNVKFSIINYLFVLFASETSRFFVVLLSIIAGRLTRWIPFQTAPRARGRAFFPR